MRSNHLQLALALCLTLGAVGCETTASGPTSDPNPKLEAAPTKTADATKAATKTLTGKLGHHDPPKTKSVAAYTHVEFVLTSDDGARHNLATSDVVSHQALLDLAGSRVELRAAWTEPTSPNPAEASPTGADGAPMKRPGRYKVLAAKKIVGP